MWHRRQRLLNLLFDRQLVVRTTCLCGLRVVLIGNLILLSQLSMAELLGVLV